MQSHKHTEQAETQMTYRDNPFTENIYVPLLAFIWKFATEILFEKETAINSSLRKGRILNLLLLQSETIGT